MEFHASEMITAKVRRITHRLYTFTSAVSRARIAVCLLPVLSAAFPCFGQVSATISGTVIDPLAASVSGAAITVEDVETGSVRSTVTDGAGHYQVFGLPVGEYEIRATKQGFAEEVQSGIHLAVDQQAIIDITLHLPSVSQEVKVTSDAPLVSLAKSDMAGLVGEQQVKELPLNGRSFDLLMTLNPGVVNFSWEKIGGTGVSNSTTANNFSVSGNRPQQNLFLLNGVEYTGAAENNMQPGGTSGMLLGVDAVREFNVLRDSYGAEYGKHPGGQVIIATESGTNQFHGSAYEFLRNSSLDAPNYFARGTTPPFQRNQFGAAAGGPIQKDKTFAFANYEGFRQHLHQTSAAFVPDLQSIADAAPSVAPLLSLWPTPTPTDPDFKSTSNGVIDPNGIAEVFSAPLQTIREDFGTTRLDHIFSEKDSLSGVYTVDDGDDFTATPADPYSADVETLREQVFSLEETHLFSGSFLNTARFGYSRAGYFFTGEPTPGTPAASVPGFLVGHPVGAVVVGGSATSNPQATVGLAGSNNGSNLRVARNLYTYEDQVTFTRGQHQFDLGVWLQQFQSNETLALSQYGQATFTSLDQFLSGTVGTFLFDPASTEMNWRSLFGAFYAEDAIRVTPKLTMSLGFRDEFSNGWNEADGRASTYAITGDVISATPTVGDSLFFVNNAKFLPQPRLGLAWSPFTRRTVFRAGFGIYNDLQDALGYRADQNAPFNPTYTVPSVSLASLPIDPAAAPPPTAKLVPGGVQPDMKMPTLISYSLRVEQELSPNMAVTIGYVGSHGYHELIGKDANEPVPTICPAAPCPATYPISGTGTPTLPATIGFPPTSPLAGAPVPAGSYYIAAGTPNLTPSLANTWTWFSLGDSNYNALQLGFTRRLSKGFALRGAYTWSRAIDDGDSLNQTAAANAPGLVANPYNLRADRGLATYDVTNLGVINAIYGLPFGHGEPYAADLEGGTDRFVSGWSVETIVTAQSGFPFTPQLSYNPSNNGDTRNPVRPFLNPTFTGPVILGKPLQWFNPNAFIGPPTASGFYGNVDRDSYIGPGLATWDFSVLKDTAVRERLRLQFRAEFFNLLNRANFNTPNLIVFTPRGVSPTAGAITSTSTTSRQVQFGLKLLW